MKKLTYKTLKEIGYNGYLLESAPEKVLQFGEGNFLRAFAEYWFDVANEKVGWNGKCVLVQPTAGGRSAPKINEQEGLYTLYLRGVENGEKKEVKRVISVVSRCLNPYTEQGYQDMMAVAVSDNLKYIVSNTTEAGIVYDPACRFEDRPAVSFPGKLTQVLYGRYQAGKPGVVILPCELVDQNGKALFLCVKQYISQWELGADFETYCREECVFCSTLVDRIVPGRVRDTAELARLEQANGYVDDMLDMGEIFGVWNIEGPAWLEEELPFKAAGLNCTVVPDVMPYKKRKVRILNGAHTGMVLGAYLGGYDIVRDCLYDDAVSGYMDKMIREEIIPTLPLDKKELKEFAAAVRDRFQNPFIDHGLLSISLNSTSKWRARNLPSLTEYVEKTGLLPPCLTMSLAAYIAFYSNHILSLQEGGLLCRRVKGDEYLCVDDRWVLEFYWAHRDDPAEVLVGEVMRNERMWGRNLTEIPGLEPAVVRDLKLIREKGALAAYASCL